MMEPPNVLSRLRNVLAILYPDEISARRIADDAGLDTRRIGFGGHALINIWHSILTEAVKTGRIRQLLGIVQAEYGANQELADAVAFYQNKAALSKPEASNLARSIPAYLRQLVDETSQLALTGIEKLADAPAQPPLKLATLYTALDTLRLHDTQDDGEQASSDEDSRQSVLHFVNQQPYAVLLGDPGSGKTTVANFLTLCLAGERLHLTYANLARLGNEWRHGSLLPLRVVAGDFALWLNSRPVAAESELLWRYLVDPWRGSLALLAELVERELSMAGGLLIVDGFDEVPEAQLQREQVKQAVLAFRRQFPHVRILLTSRIYAYQRQQWRLPDFEEAVLAPFNQMQIQTFIEHWYSDLAQYRSMPRAQDRAVQLKYAVETNPHLYELATRPLLLTLLASLHVWRDGNLPEQRVELYEQSIQLLLERWEQPKHAPQSSADAALSNGADNAIWPVTPTIMRKALEALAYQVQASQTKSADTANITETDLLAVLSQASRDPDLRPMRVIEFIRDRAGLLATCGEGIYSFPHRAIQEYLAACYLITNQFPILLLRLVRADPERWREVLRLAGARVALTQPYLLWTLIGKLCPRPWRVATNQNTTENEWLCVVLAGQLLVETGNQHMAGLEEEDAEKMAHVVSWLLALVSQTLLAPPDRALSGRILATLGDARPGVQLNPTNQLPDIVWLRLEAGAFLMGSEPVVEQVIQEPFSISRYPITVAQYQAFIEAGGYKEQKYWSSDGWAWRRAGQIAAPQTLPAIFQTTNHPQVGVSWYEATAFCRWLSEQMGRQIQLPTEWQWERAARHRDGRLYPWGNEFGLDYANTRQTNLGATSAVGIFPKGDAVCGAADMAGNVWEWCRTIWHSQSTQPEAGTRQKVNSRKRYILRGGSFANPPKLMRCANRHRNYADHRASNVGFRVVMR